MPEPGDSIVLDHVRGVHRGTRTVLDEAVEYLGTGHNATVHFPALRAPQVRDFHGTLTRQGNDYLFAVEPTAPVHVNGRPFSGGLLTDGDLIELGKDGPMMRYRHVPVDRKAAFKSLSETLSDAVDSARVRSANPVGMMARVATELPAEMIARSAPGTRIVSIVLLVVLISAMGWIGLRTLRIEQALSEQSAEFSDALGLFRSENALSLDELRSLRADLQSTNERVQNASTGAILERIAPSIVFVQGAFGFRDKAGRPLRVAVDSQGRIMRDPTGQPFVSATASGPVFTQQYTGTAFVVSEDGMLVTNRHVALPWEFDQAALRAMESGLTPFMHRLVGYVAGRADAFDVALVGASDEADVAVLSSDVDTQAARPIPFSDTAPSLGDRVLVLGYPTGIRALLARTDPAFVNELFERTPQPDFWELAAALAGAGHIAPLVSEGIVGQITATAVVYDAATTHGGSGGPVVNADGELIAVNAAIVPEFGGANMGVPVERVRALVSRTDPARTPR